MGSGSEKTNYTRILLQINVQQTCSYIATVIQFSLNLNLYIFIINCVKENLQIINISTCTISSTWATTNICGPVRRAHLFRSGISISCLPLNCTNLSQRVLLLTAQISHVATHRLMTQSATWYLSNKTQKQLCSHGKTSERKIWIIYIRTQVCKYIRKLIIAEIKLVSLPEVNRSARLHDIKSFAACKESWFCRISI